MLLMLLITLLVLVVSTYLVLPSLVRLAGRLVGTPLRSSGSFKRDLIIQRVKTERLKHEENNFTTTSEDGWEKIDKKKISSDDLKRLGQVTNKDWNGVVGFFHPFCNAGGGGERVLWAAIHATQQRWPNAICVVYTGDHEVSKPQMLKRVEDRFGIKLHSPSVVFLYLSTRHYVLASTWPRFTLLGQSFGSLLLAWEALNLLVPDVFIDTMGYAFAIGLCRFIFPTIPTGAYVHYPTISTDMLSSLDAQPETGKGLNAGAGRGVAGNAKRRYWQAFASLYSWVGGSVDVVMCNGTWTAGHIRQLWGPGRSKRKYLSPIDVVYPPCAVEDMESKITVSARSEAQRKPTMLYIAQFRPEKNHQLILRAFADVLDSIRSGKVRNAEASDTKLLLIGSVRDSADETYIYSLRLLVNELKIKDNVEFLLNASWSRILDELQKCSIGVNGMWNEHFGIGVVEYQAAGLISVVNDSGGPKWDIVVDQGDGPTGYHASEQREYADGFAAALALSEEDKIAMRLRARRSAKRFSEKAFEDRWSVHMDTLIGLAVKHSK